MNWDESFCTSVLMQAHKKTSPNLFLHRYLFNSTYRIKHWQDISLLSHHLSDKNRLKRETTIYVLPSGEVRPNQTKMKDYFKEEMFVFLLCSRWLFCLAFFFFLFLCVLVGVFLLLFFKVGLKWIPSVKTYSFLQLSFFSPWVRESSKWELTKYNIQHRICSKSCTQNIKWSNSSNSSLKKNKIREVHLAW